MKFLVLAADAQSGVGSESKGRGRSTMACGRRPFLRGDQFILMKRGNLRYCMQIQLDSVACLEWCRRMIGEEVEADGHGTAFFSETYAAKEARNRWRLSRKTPRLRVLIRSSGD